MMKAQEPGVAEVCCGNRAEKVATRFEKNRVGVAQGPDSTA